ncbi:unnamed protein product [Prorocentrum cordatum]|uniref:Probable beta-glucosidase G n=1 Tax=Prorocentrum cordatum TaxID=2364126 RepID=A0ABN9WNL0_9DINO|nr:unnamed protein product [Polarella glacialis]
MHRHEILRLAEEGGDSSDGVGSKRRSDVAPSFIAAGATRCLLACALAAASSSLTAYFAATVHRPATARLGHGATITLEKLEFSTRPNTGCDNWRSIVVIKDSKPTAEECYGVCASTDGCRSAGYQTKDCPGNGLQQGSCFIYGGDCETTDDDCWDLVSPPEPEPEGPEEPEPEATTSQQPAEAAARALRRPGEAFDAPPAEADTPARRPGEAFDPPPAEADAQSHAAEAAPPDSDTATANKTTPHTAGFGCGNWRSFQVGSFHKGLSADECGEECQATTGCQSYTFQPNAECDGDGSGEGACMLFVGKNCSLVQDDCWDYYELQTQDSHCNSAAPLAVPETRAEVSAWAADLVSQMTNTEKWTMVRGTMNKGSWVGMIKGIRRLGIPPLTMQDGPQGFRTTSRELVGQVTSWPCALAVTATWDARAMRRWAQAMGQEFKAKGASIALGPGVNVNRVAVNGRNAEYISGEDTYLASKLVGEFVQGMQGEGVAAVVKHFVNNEQEDDRTEVDIIIDERTLWEVYYPPFQAAVDAGVASVMCSYNSVNGHPACENIKTLQEDLKGTMGFDGFVMSDWDAIKTTHGAAAGADQDLPAGTFFTDEVLENLSSTRLNDMVQRVLQGMARAWAASPDGLCAPGCACGHAHGVVEDSKATAPLLAEHRTLAQDLASQGAVLLKNERGALPLKAAGKVAVLGRACDARHNISLDDWLDMDYYVVGGSGRVAATNATSVVQGLRKSNLTLEESLVNDLKLARFALAGSQVAVVCGGVSSTESLDRKNLSLNEDMFIFRVISIASELQVPVVVVALAPGPVVMGWRHEASAVLLMFLSGERTGDAAAAVMTGQVNPSGRLPLTIPVFESDPVPHCSCLRVLESVILSPKLVDRSPQIRSSWFEM